MISKAFKRVGAWEGDEKGVADKGASTNVAFANGTAAKGEGKGAVWGAQSVTHGGST